MFNSKLGFLGDSDVKAVRATCQMNATAFVDLAASSLELSGEMTFCSGKGSTTKSGIAAFCDSLSTAADVEFVFGLASNWALLQPPGMSNWVDAVAFCLSRSLQSRFLAEVAGINLRVSSSSRPRDLQDYFLDVQMALQIADEGYELAAFWDQTYGDEYALLAENMRG